MDHSVVKTCLICGTDFVPQKNTKTCSLECSEINKTRKDRAYQNNNHNRCRSIAALRKREVIAHDRLDRRVRRAVNILFDLAAQPT